MTGMGTAPSIDGILVQWGERLFYPGVRLVRPPRLSALTQQKAATIRRRIEATVRRRAPQVMVKVTGGGRGMGAIAAHFRYISKNGRLNIEDDRGVVRNGKDALHDLADQWRYGGSYIDDAGHRREAFNIMLSMPSGTDPLIVQRAAREFAKAELIGHRYVMVLHDHQANPHVHLSVRAESLDGVRLNPRKADLHRWRETFAAKLRGWGIEAEATRQATRAANRGVEPLWRVKAAQDGRLMTAATPKKDGDRHKRSRNGALEAWAHIMQALLQSSDPQDQALAQNVARFVRESDYAREVAQRRQREGVTPKRERSAPVLQAILPKGRPGPDTDIER